MPVWGIRCANIEWSEEVLPRVSSECVLCKARFHLPYLQECCEWNTEIIKLAFPCQLSRGLGIWYIDELGQGHFGCSALLRLFDLPLFVLFGPSAPPKVVHTTCVEVQTAQKNGDVLI